MRDLLNKGFEALGSRDEKREERMDVLLTRNVEAMAHRPTLRLYTGVLGGVNVLLWVAVLLRPYDVLAAFSKISAVNDRSVMIVIGIVFGIGMWLTYALFRLKFPDLEELSQSTEVMSSFADSEKTTRKVRVWVASVVGGVLNLLALAIVFGLLVSNQP
jgi:type IV secretory pathway VirB6-like protein